MTSQSEFVPIGTPVTTSRKLELEFRDEQQFIYEMSGVGYELEKSPLVTPTLREIKLGQIALLDEHGSTSRSDKMWLQFSETDDGRRNAIVDLLEGETLTRLQLSQTSDKWDVWQKGSKEPISQIDKDQVLTTIHPKLRNKEILAPLLDTAGFDSMAIPHLLAAYLTRAARRREKKSTYRLNDPTIQGLDSPIDELDTSYVSSTKTEFSVYRNNGRSVHRIATSTVYPVGISSIEKGYGYIAEKTRAGISKEAGAITISSSDGFTEDQLKNYAEIDQLNNEPLSTLRHSLYALHNYFETKDKPRP